MGGEEGLRRSRTRRYGEQTHSILGFPSACLAGSRCSESQGVSVPLVLAIQDRGSYWLWLQGFFDPCGVSE